MMSQQPARNFGELPPACEQLWFRETFEYLMRPSVFPLRQPEESVASGSDKVSRVSTLDAAKASVTGQRTQDYGSPEDSFATIAKLWSVLLDVEIRTDQVAQMMIALKLARLKTSPGHEDSWVDVAGYAACGAEIACK